tara:strand:+ start:10991 stop:13390 length:2400 start_codon:yes stop_codon:yes gene_type:complete
MLSEENPSELLDDWRLERVEEHLGEDLLYYPKYLFTHDYHSDEIIVINYAANGNYKNELELYFYNQKMFTDLKKEFKEKGYKQIEKIINFNEQKVIFKKKNTIINTIENLDRDEYYIEVFNYLDNEKREKIGYENKIQNYLENIEDELKNWGNYISEKDKIILNESEIQSFLDYIVSPFIIYFDKIDEVYSENTFDNDIEKKEKKIYNLLVSSVNHHVSSKFENIKESIDLLTSKENTLETESLSQLINEYLEFFSKECYNFGREFIEENISCFSVNKNLDKNSNVKKEFNKLIKNIKAYIQTEKEKIIELIEEGDKLFKEEKYLEAYSKYDFAEIKAYYWNLNIPVNVNDWFVKFSPIDFLEICLEKKHLTTYYIQIQNTKTKINEAKELFQKGSTTDFENAIKKYEEIINELACGGVCKFKFCKWRLDLDCIHDETLLIYDHPKDLDENLMKKYYYESKQKLSELTALLKEKKDKEKIWSFKDENQIKYESFLNQVQEKINSKIIKKNNGEIGFFFKIKFDESGNNLSGPMELDDLNNYSNSIYNDSFIAEFDNYATSKSTSKITYLFNEETGDIDSKNEIINYFVPSEEIIKFYCIWSSEKKYISHEPKNPAFSQKIISEHPYLKDSYGSYKFLTKSINIKDKQNHIIEKSILEFTSNNGPKYAFYSFLLPGLGTSKVTNGQKGKGKTVNFLLSTAASIALRLYSNMQYEKYLVSTNKNEMNDLYESANMLNKISLGTSIIAASIYVQDIISAFSKGNENIKKSKILRTKLKNGRLKILDEKPLQENFNTDLKSNN